MKKFIWFFGVIFICHPSHAIYLYFAHDMEGKTISSRYGGAEYNCPKLMAWNGSECANIPIVEKCKSFGGTWGAVQIYSAVNKNKFKFIDVCNCPNGQGWDGQGCTEIAAENICYSYSQNPVLLDKKLFGSDCHPFPK